MKFKVEYDPAKQRFSFYAKKFLLWINTDIYFVGRMEEEYMNRVDLTLYSLERLIKELERLYRILPTNIDMFIDFNSEKIWIVKTGWKEFFKMGNKKILKTVKISRLLCPLYREKLDEDFVDIFENHLNINLLNELARGTIVIRESK